MGKVVLVDFQRPDMVGELRKLLVKASSGKLVGLAFTALDDKGRETSAFVGRFRGCPSEAARVAGCLSARLGQVRDAKQAAPIFRDG